MDILDLRSATTALSDFAPGLLLFGLPVPCLASGLPPSRLLDLLRDLLLAGFSLIILDSRSHLSSKMDVCIESSSKRRRTLKYPTSICACSKCSSVWKYRCCE